MEISFFESAKDHSLDVLSRVLAPEGIALAKEIWSEFEPLPVFVSISAPRKRTLGDCRYTFDGTRIDVTINSDLGRNAALYVALHEFAHAKAQVFWKSKRMNVGEKHGSMWKLYFSRYLKLASVRNCFPTQVVGAIKGHAERPRATIPSSFIRSLDLDYGHVAEMERIHTENAWWNGVPRSWGDG